MRVPRQCGSWIGSAMLHAALIVALACWTLKLGTSAKPLALTGVISPELGEPETLQDAFWAPTAGPAWDRFQLVSLKQPFQQPSRGYSGPTLSTLSTGRPGDAPLKRGRGVKFFGATAYGNRIIFVMDISGSMSTQSGEQFGRSRFERAKAELLTALNGCEQDQLVAVVLFNHRCRTMLDQPLNEEALLPATEANKSRLAAWLQRVQPRGATDPRDSIRTALSALPDAVFLLSDGEFKTQGGHRISGKAIRLIRRLNARDVPIHTIAYQDRNNRQTLERIAKESGGSYRFVP